MTAHLCLDIGGTATRARLYGTGGDALAHTTTDAGAISLGVERTRGAIDAIWSALAAQLGSKLPERASTHLVAGLAGIGLRDRVEALIALVDDFASARFVGDGYGALLDATGGRPGVLIAVGTGVAGMRLMGDGTSRTMSGWGFPAGDLGSGAWIGLQTVSALTRHLDGSRDANALTPDLARPVMDIVGHAPADIMTWHMTAKPGQFASLAPLVVEAAHKGDPFAEKLMRAAAAEIIDVARCLYDHTPGLVHLTGGLGAPLLPYCASQAPQFDWQQRQVDPLSGLFLLASGTAPDEKLVARPGVDAPDY